MTRPAPSRDRRQEAQLTLEDVDLRLLMHNDFGKGFMKKCKVSPDAFIQMALQLAYYRVRRPPPSGSL